MRAATVALAAVLAAGCGRDDGATTAPAAPVKGLVGTVSKGPLQGATVTFYAVNVDGSAGAPITGITPSLVTTDANGAFGPVLNLPTGQPILVRALGGDYVDESDPETDPGLRRHVTFTSGQGLEAVLPAGNSGSATLTITPYSMALYLKAKAQAAAAGGVNFPAIYEATLTQWTGAFGFNPVTTTPANPLTGTGGSAEYGLLLGAAALEINRIATTASPSHVPAYGDVMAFVDDMADGVLKDSGDPADTPSLADLLRRFRNNNIAVYSGTPAPTVDESALAPDVTVPNQAPAITGQNALATAEETGLTLTVADFTIEDPDSSSFTLAVQAGSDYAVAGNTITPATDFNGTLTVPVTVDDGQASSAVFNATVTVSPVNDAPVVADQAFATLPENSANATVVGTVAYADAEGGAMVHSIVGGNTGGAFSIDSITGVVSVANSAALDFETTPGFTLTVQVQDSGGLSDTALVTIPLSSINEPPVVDDQSLPSLAENSPNGTVVGTVLSTDPDAGDTRTYSLLTGSPDGAYAINASTGQVTVANAALLNFEATPSTSLFVQVQDAGGITDTATVTVALTNVNEAPVANDQSLTPLPENSGNGVVVGSVASSDPDAGDTRTYSITAGNTLGAFAINGTSGQVTVANSAALDFEATPSFTLTVQVTDAGSLSDTALVTIALSNVNEAPVVNDQALAAVAENSANGTVVGTVAASDPDASDTKTYSITAGNTGGAFAIGAGTGQVTVATSAALDFESTPSFVLTVQVTDAGALSDTALVTIALSDVNEAPTASADSISLTEGGSATTLVGGATSVLANDGDPENDTLTATLVSGPANAAFFLLNADGTFTYTHDGSETTTDSFTYEADDGVLGSNTATVTISVAPANDPPVAVDDAVATSEDTPVNIADTTLLANDIDPDGPSLSVAGVGNAVNGGVVLVGSTITFTPDTDFVGTASFEYTVSDGTDTDVGVVNVIVGGANDPPTAASDGPYFAQHDQTLVVVAPGVLGNDTDPDAETLTASLTTAPSNGLLNLNADGSFDYTPSGGYTGPDSFTYDACDAALACSPATVTISVVNMAPVAGSDTYNVQHDQTLVVPVVTGVLSNDSDADPVDTLAAVLTVAPSNGLLNLNADGSFEYTPSGGFSGTDTFTYEADDGDAFTTVTATVTINVVNTAPVAGADTYNVQHDQVLTVPAAGVLSNDSDADPEDTLSAVLTVAPSNGLLNLNADGSFEYTPSGGFSGTDTFTYEADDGDSFTSVTATVTINVVNTAPVAVDDGYSVPHDTTLTIDAPSGVLANDSDADPEDMLSAVLTVAPSNGLLNLNADGSFDYTPSGGFNGTDSFTYEADDGDSFTSVTATVTITVTNGAPQAFDDGCSLPPCATPLPSGALAWYAASGDATDVTGQYDGTLNGAVTFPAAQVGPGFAFNGVDTGVALAPGSFVMDQQEFSFNLWVNPAATQNQYAIIVDNNHSGSRNWVIQQNNFTTNQYLFGMNDGTGGITFTLQANVWQHLAVTRKANVSRLYINGVEVAGSPVSGGAIPIGNASTVNGVGAGGVPELHLGRYKINDPTGGFRRWNGLMDEVQFFDRGLSAAEVKALYQAGIDGTGHDTAQVGATLPPGLTAWYRGQGNAGDSAGTHEGALFGGAGFAAGTVGGAFSFDGVDDEAVTAPQTWGITTSGTVAAWINTTDDFGSVVSLAHGDVLDELLLFVDNGKISVFNHKSGNNYTKRTSASAVNTGSWVFVAGVIDGGMNNLRVYVDGVEEAGTFTTVGSPSNLADGTPRELRIGNRNHAIPGDFLAGLVDEAQVYGRALSPREIRELYDAGPAGIRAVPGAFEVLEDASLSSTVAAMLLNDTDPDPDSLFTSPATYLGPGSVSINGDGTFDYFPAPGFNGVDTFTYTVDDGVESSTPATVYLNVLSVNDAPAGADNSVAVDEDLVYTFAPSEFGFSDLDDSPADAFAAIRVAQVPSNGILYRGVTPVSVGQFVSYLDINTGELTFVPDAEFNGSVGTDFLFQVQDDGGKANGGVDLDPIARTMAIFVNPVNDAPVASVDPLVVIEDATATDSVTASDADGDTLTYGVAAFVSGPYGASAVTAKGTVTINGDGFYTYVPNANATGTDSFFVRVSDGNGGSAFIQVEVTIAAVNDAPTPADDAISVDEGGTATQLVGPASSVLDNDTDPDGDLLAATVSTPPAFASFFQLNSDGTFVYTHDGSQNFTDSFTYLADDANGGSALATVVITINSINDAPTVSLPLVPVAMNQSTEIAPITVSDDDASVTLTLSVAPLGTLLVKTDATGGVIPAGNVSGNGTSTVVVTASIAQLNTTFNPGSGGLLLDVGAPGTRYTGPVMLSADIDDGAGPVSDSELLPVINFELSAYAGGDATASAGLAGGDFAGRTVAGGGDFNGDGFDDYVIGAYGANSGAGAAYLVFGGLGGLPTGVDLAALDGTNGFRIDGAAAGHQAGVALALDGDFNNDGLDDLVIGADGNDRAYVLYGEASPAPAYDLAISQCFGGLGPDLIVGGSGGSQFGASLAYADVNGDGADDLLVGAPGDGSGAGAAYVVFGWQSFEPALFPPNVLVECAGAPTIGIGFLDGTNGFALGGLAGVDRAGHSVAGGDVNGDGFGDVVVGAPTDPASPSGPGRALVFFGHAGTFNAAEDLSTLDGTNGFVLDGEALGDRAGVSVAAGDFNGDGFDDVVVGADHADVLARTDGGAAYVVYGASGGFPANLTLDASNLNGVNGSIVVGMNVGDNAGAQVALAGDVNGDGLGDLLVGAPLGNPNGVADAGIASVVYGQAPGFPSFVDLGFVDGTDGFHVNGAAAGDLTGSVGRGGDLNGDGFDDIHVGASQHGGTGRGYTVFGYDYRRVAESIGGSATAGSSFAILVGSGASDILDDGAQVPTLLKAGAGDDILRVTPTGPSLADGGGGYDTLQIGAGILDLATENGPSGDRRYRRIESIALMGDAQVNIGARTVLRMSDIGTVDISGVSSAPNPVASNDAWLREGFDDGSGFAHYRNGHARLSVDNALNRDQIPVTLYWEPQTGSANGASGQPSLSGTGWRVVFSSYADNLVASPAVPAGVSQVYLRDVRTGAVTLLSQSGGVAGTGDSGEPVISVDGRYVAFRTAAAELLGGDPPSGPQVVLLDTTDGTIRVVSDDCGECQFDSTVGRISLSADARYVAFIGRPNAPDTLQVYRMDLQTFTLDVASVVGGIEYCGTTEDPNACYSATMSGDGRWIAWNTTNDVLASDANLASDVLLRDMGGSEVRLVSNVGGFSPSGHSAAPSIGADGRRLAFESEAPLVAGDTNGTGDIYVYEIASQTLSRASTDNAGADAAGVLGVAVGEDPIGAPVMSGDGRRLLYTTDVYGAPVVKALDCSAGCIDDGDGDLMGELVIGRYSRDGAPLNALVSGTALSFDGRIIGAYSLADNVVAGDVNGQQDVFAGLNPLYAVDYLTDSDGDGLANADELGFIGTNPLVTDTDGDGLSDGDEYNIHFTDPTEPDTDGDGVGDGLEIALGSSAYTPQGQVLRVSPQGHDFNCNGQSFADWDGNTPALVDCALQTNAGVTNVLFNGTDPANRAYVLYRYNANYGALDLTGTPRQYISFIGSLEQGVYKPIGGANDVSLSAFVPSGQFPAATIADATDVTFHNIRFTGGNGYGAGIAISEPPASSLVFEDVLVDNNGQSQANDAGGVRVGGGSSVTMRRSRIANNLASNPSGTAYGGGVTVTDGTLVLEDSEVSGNTVSGTSGAGAGGGIAVVGSTSALVARNTLVRDNFADGQGGGLSVTDGAAAILELGSLVIDNLVDGPALNDGIGGGVYVGLNASLTVEDSGISGNATGDTGGGIHAASAASLLLHNAIVATNSAEGDGGGLYLIDSGATQLRHSRFLSNSSGRNGGGVYVENSTGLFQLFDNLFVGNVGANFSLSFGGGLHYAGTNDGAQTFVHSNTFAWNQTHHQTQGAGGGAYFAQSQNVDFIHNIFQFNDNDDLTTVDAEQNVAAVGAGALSYASNNIGGDSNPGGFDSDPLFTEGFYLTQTSPSVDGGFNTAAGVGLAAPYTTDPLGAGDSGLVDVGFHHTAPSAGALAGLANVSPGDGSLMVGCVNAVVFTPMGPNGPLGPGRRIDVQLFTSDLSAALGSRTTFEPRGVGSRIAIDYGDGRYGVRVHGFSGSGNLALDIHADDGVAPQTLTYTAFFSCS